MLAETKKDRYIKTITVASGKGGVGKTNIVASLAIAIQKIGKKVLIFDADLGLSNIDVLLNLSPRYDIQHVISGEKGLVDVLIDGPFGIKILPASSGVQELTELDEFQRMRLIEEFDSCSIDIDVLLVDTGAGISSNVAFFCVASQEIIIIVSPEPTSLTDSYALIKVLNTRYQEKNFKVIVNFAKDPSEALKVFERLSVATERFLNISLDYLGFIPLDECVPKAVRSQKAFADIYPGSASSSRIFEIAERLMRGDRSNIKGTVQFFLGNLLMKR